MSERDDEYLWSGQGEAPDEVGRLEKLFAGEKLRDPLRARPPRLLPRAILVAALVAGAAFWLMRNAPLPVSWTGAVLPGVSADELRAGTYQFEAIDTPTPPGWEKAIEARLGEFEPSSVRFSGRRVRVHFADNLPLGLENVVGRHAELALKEAVENSPLMAAFYRRVAEGDPLAAKLGVTAEIDAWDHDESGRRYSDYFLAADTEQALHRYLASVTEPELQTPPGFEIALEEQRPDDEGRVRWRTHYLDSRAWISNRDIVNAYTYWNEVTNRPEVLVEFDREGGQRFADLTARITGRKLAILLDGRVSSAPVVQDRIAGGRISITMGGGNAREVQDEANALAGVLAASEHPLPVALRLVALTRGADQVSEGQRELVRGVIAGLIGLFVFAAVFALERKSRRIDPEVAPVRGRARRRSLPWLRLTVTVAGAAAAILAERIPVSAGIDWGFFGGRHVGLFELGIMPALSAFLLVELAALIVPRWRPLRRGGPSARARLGSATAIVTVLLALIQAWMIADFMHSVPPLAHLSRGMLVASLTTGALVMTFLALAISRYGMGNGFAALLLAGHAVVLHHLGHELAPGIQPAEVVLPFLLAVAATAIATSWILRHRVSGPSPASSIRLPTAGIVPLAVVPSLLILFALSWPEAAARIGIWWQETMAGPGAGVLIELGFLVASGAALSWLFSRPARLGDATAGRARSHGFLIATAISLVYLVLLALLGRWSATVLGWFALTLLPVALATAIVMDLVAEWRALRRRDDLVPIWPLHQVQRVDLVTGALAKNDIDVHTRGLYLRLLLHFFGPFVPVLIYVPAAQAEEARAIIRAQLEAR